MHTRHLSTAVAFAFLVVCGPADADDGLMAQLSDIAPDFAFGLQVAASDVRSREHALRLATTQTLYSDIDDGGTFNSDPLTFAREDGLDLFDQPVLVQYAVIPDQYVLNAMKSGTVSYDPVIDHHVACAVGLERYWQPEDVQALSETLATLPAFDGMDAAELSDMIPHLLRAIAQNRPLFFDIPDEALPMPSVALLRDCQMSLEAFSQSESDAAAIGLQWFEQIKGVGRHLAEIDAPDGWAVTYEMFGGQTSTEPLDAFSRLKFRLIHGPNIALSGPIYADGSLQELRFDPRTTPRFSEVYDRWTVATTMTVKLRVPLTEAALEELMADTFFEMR